MLQQSHQFKSEAWEKHNEKDRICVESAVEPCNWTECFISLGLILFLFASSSIALGLAADRLTRGVVVMTTHRDASLP